jgi:hypothetical protein
MTMYLMQVDVQKSASVKRAGISPLIGRLLFPGPPTSEQQSAIEIADLVVILIHCILLGISHLLYILPHKQSIDSLLLATAYTQLADSATLHIAEREVGSTKERTQTSHYGRHDLRKCMLLYTSA